MPLIRGDAGGDKPIIRVALIPALARPSEVDAKSQINSLEMLECRALLDTGADGTSVSRSAAQAAKLRSYGKMPVVGIGGQNYHRTWGLYLGLFSGGNSPPFVISEPLLAVEIPDNNWFEVIIGRDILNKGTFIMRPGGTFEFELPDET
ncbi:aspartyl protease family protein [Tsuneonella sp. HG222]